MDHCRIEDLLDLNETIAASIFEGLEHPWEALAKIHDWILACGAVLDADDSYEKRGEDIWVAKDAHVFESAYLHGPLIIGHGAEVRHCAFIRGSAIVGEGAVVGNSTELKNVLLFNAVQVPHYNYVGDSILGYKAHMGAGSITSNVRSDKKNIIVHDEDTEYETGLRKFGAVLGDHAEVGCGSVLNPGTVIGRGSRVHPLSSVRRVVPAGCIHKDNGQITVIRQTDR